MDKIGFEEGENVKSKRDNDDANNIQQTNFDKKSKAHLGWLIWAKKWQ